MQDLRTATDQALVAGVVALEADAVAEIYRRHGRVVFAQASSRLSSRTAAEDVTQEIFLRLWREPGAFDANRGTLRAWLVTQAHHRAIDAYRSERAMVLRQGKHAVSTPAIGSTLEDKVLTRLDAERARQAVRRLPPDQRLAIELAYFGGHSYRRVAELLGEPVGTVKSRIRAGLHCLREVLAADAEPAVPAVA